MGALDVKSIFLTLPRRLSYEALCLLPIIGLGWLLSWVNPFLLFLF